MAEGIFYVCGKCQREIHVWDDGNPYYFDARGKKIYAYHPDPERARCTGNDSSHICLNCGAEFKVDSNSPRTDCPQCHSAEISPTFTLDGKPCPYCKQGTFARGSTRLDIS